MSASRRRTVGAELAGDGVHFRVWAPQRRSLRVVIDGAPREFELDREEGGYFAGVVADARAGTRYRFRLDGGNETYPDPASRFQPDGPHGSSMVIDPEAFRWTDSGSKSIGLRDAVIYEMHFGTFTAEGTYRSAIAELDRLKAVGITLLEIMPVHEFPGCFGWGYDGVDLFAPAHVYGTPDDLRAFVDAAHAKGLAVILDVVYNHFGPDGCYLSKFTPDYFTKKYENDWGEAINFEGAEALGVRELIAENAAYWIDEFHFDGLRLDATQSIQDASEKNILEEIVDRARRAARDKQIVIVAENEPQDVKLIERYGIDALWNDDWHHAAMVAATGKAEAYYTDYRGAPQEFVSMALYGFLYQGQRYKWQKNRRGTPSIGVSRERLICYVQNHDQVANSADGRRLHQITSPGRYRALTALLLLGPNTPMLFQGQEFAASAPFLYFADHKPELAVKVAEGRGDFLDQFPSIAAIRSNLAVPHDPKTFQSSKLDWREFEANGFAVRLHRDLLRLRRTMPRDTQIGGAILGDKAFLLRWITDDHSDLLLLVNLGRELHLDPAPEPLLAPPPHRTWAAVWSTESVEYGGSGLAEVESEENWRIPAEAAVVLKANAVT